MSHLHLEVRNCVSTEDCQYSIIFSIPIIVSHHFTYSVHARSRTVKTQASSIVVITNLNSTEQSFQMRAFLISPFHRTKELQVYLLATLRSARTYVHEILQHSFLSHTGTYIGVFMIVSIPLPFGITYIVVGWSWKMNFHAGPCNKRAFLRTLVLEARQLAGSIPFARLRQVCLSGQLGHFSQVLHLIQL